MESLHVFGSIEKISESTNIISSKWIFKYKKTQQVKLLKKNQD